MISEQHLTDGLDAFKAYLPNDDAEAARQYAQWGAQDPFYDEIEPALLNSQDFLTYVAAAGMIHPFEAELEHLHPASYAVPLRGKCIRWEDDSLSKRCVQEIAEGEEFYLPHDSIAFLTLEPVLRIPDYIALRFNLRVDNAYRGLLLGTGPLVDPGFQGRLSIPLHNFTTNDYQFTGGDRLIWVEFTKLSQHPDTKPNWESHPRAARERERLAELRENALHIPYKRTHYQEAGDDSSWPKRKKEKSRDELPTVSQYLREAAPHSPVFSSTRHALDTADKAIRRFRQIGIVGAIGTAALVLLAIVPLWWMKMDYQEDLETLRQQVEQVQIQEGRPGGATDGNSEQMPSPATQPDTSQDG